VKNPNDIYVVGRYTGTTYGPFESEGLAQSFIRVELGSSTRYYETFRGSDLPARSRRAAVKAWGQA
jgi:hypothetical protein